MENWVISLSIAAVGAIATYAVLKERVTRIISDQREHSENDITIHSKQNEKMDAGFKKLDEIINRMTIVESKTAKHLDLETAEDKFVTRKELHLILDNLALTTKHTDTIVSEVKKDMGELKGKLEDFMIVISKEISNKGR